MNLEKFNPDEYKRTIEISTRKKRENEIDGYDYHFISPEKYEEIKNDLFERVETQFYPNKYGASKDELVDGKWNIIVASIEGFLSAILGNSFSYDDENVLVNIINDCELDVQREGRNPLQEEYFNLSVLNQFRDFNILNINNNPVYYYEIKLSELKEIRNNKEKCLEKFESFLNNKKYKYGTSNFS